MKSATAILLFASFGLVHAEPATAGADPVDRSWTILVEGTKNGNPIKRKEAVAALSLLPGSSRGVEMAEVALTDKDSDVREMAASVLGEIKARRAIPKLKESLQDQSAQVSFMAARSLWNMGDRSGRDVITTVLAGDRSNGVSGMIHDEMHDAKNKLHQPSQLALMGIKESAGTFLGPFSFGIMVVEELRKDGSATARTLAAASLATDPDPSSLVNLEDSLNDKNWVVRIAAAKALAQRGDASAIPKLAPALDDSHDAVKAMAAAAIIKLDMINRKLDQPEAAVHPKRHPRSSQPVLTPAAVPGVKK